MTNTKEINIKDSLLSLHLKSTQLNLIKWNPKVSENLTSQNFLKNKLRCLMTFLHSHLIDNLSKCSQTDILIWRKNNILSKNILQYFLLMNLVNSTEPNTIIKTTPELLLLSVQAAWLLEVWWLDCMSFQPEKVLGNTVWLVSVLVLD